LANTMKIAVRIIDATVENTNKDFQFILSRTIFAKNPQSPHKISVVRES